MDKSALKETYGYHKIGDLQMNIYEPSCDVPYHWHDEWEFLSITDGECECIVNGKSFVAKKGQAILINGGELHTINSGSTGQFFAVVFHPYVVFGSELKHLVSKKKAYNRIYNQDMINESEIIRLLSKAYSVFCTKNYGYELTLKSILMRIVAIIYENELYTARQLGEIQDFNPFADILEYVHSNFSEKLSLDDVSKYASFSKSYIIRLFKKNTGKTFSSYLNSYRIYKAVEMLENTDKSILDISELCGFGSVAYFIKLFKESMGITPHKYRIP